MNRTVRRSPLALAILSLLIESPMHPYRMQQLIKQRDKDAVINVRQRASLYQMIERLARSGLITVQETARSENRPERTVYRITEHGTETARGWMRDMLAMPAREFPEFPAALAHLPLLSPEEVASHLAERVAVLSEAIADAEAQMRLAESILPRVFVVEAEYLRAMQQAELDWTRALVDDLREGRLTWSAESVADAGKRLSPAMPRQEGDAMA